MIVTVGVCVIVGVAVDSRATAPVCCKAKYTKTAPIVRNNASNPRAAGRLTVTSGIRLPCTALDARLLLSGLPNSAPQTRQRSASKPTRVPQVGQSFVDVVSFSGLMSNCIFA